MGMNPGAGSAKTGAFQFLLELLGALDAAAATGAVTSTDNLTAYLKQIVTNTYLLAEAADGTGVYPASVADDSILAKILSKSDPAAASSYSNLTDSLEAIRDRLAVSKAAPEAEAPVAAAPAKANRTGIFQTLIGLVKRS